MMSLRQDLSLKALEMRQMELPTCATVLALISFRDTFECEASPDPCGITKSLQALDSAVATAVDKSKA